MLNLNKFSSAKTWYLSLLLNYAALNFVVSITGCLAKVVRDGSTSGLDPAALPSRLVTDDDLKSFCHAMKLYEQSNIKSVKSNVRTKVNLEAWIHSIMEGVNELVRLVPHCVLIYLLTGVS